MRVHDVLVSDASLTVTSASALGVGASQPVDILGTSFVSGAVVTISGITGVSTQFVDSTHLRVVVPAPTNRAIGAHDVTVTNPAPGGTATCSSCFIVNARPTITAVTPNTLFQGSGPTDITLTGTGFQPGAQVTAGKAGITVNSTSVVSPTSTIVTVTIDSGTVIGLSALTVTNPDGGKTTKAGALTVKERPSISGVIPNSRGQGATATVIINGNGFAANFVALGGTVSFGPGIAVNSVTRNSGKKLSVTISVLKDAVAALRDVTVTNPDGEIGICQGCFTVTAAPAITSLNPSHVSRGTATAPRVTRVTLTGTGFQAGLTVKIPNPAGVSPIGFTVSSNTTAVLDVSVTAKAGKGPRDITLTNPDGGTITLIGGLVVDP